MCASTARRWSTMTGSTGTSPCSCWMVACCMIPSWVGCIMKPTLDDRVAKCNYVRMDPRKFPRDACAIGAALEHLGDRWTLLVLREAFFGVRRFEELRRNT